MGKEPISSTVSDDYEKTAKGNEGRKKGRKEGRKEGRKKGRKEGRKEGRKKIRIIIIYCFQFFSLLLEAVRCINTTRIKFSALGSRLW
jgi:predicted transposase YdaD